MLPTSEDWEAAHMIWRDLMYDDFEDVARLLVEGGAAEIAAGLEERRWEAIIRPLTSEPDSIRPR